MALDFDATVVAIAAQPFWLSWTTGRRPGRDQDRAPAVVGWIPASAPWHPGLAGALWVVFEEPAPLLVSAEAVGDPIAVLPVLLDTGLAVRADLTIAVRRAKAAEDRRSARR